MEALAESRSSNTQSRGNETAAALYDVGVFYFKVGFASNLSDRMRQHRCSAPFVEVVKAWTCRRLWEKTVIECVKNGCEQLHTEVFRTHSIEVVKAKCEQFFELMPKLNGK